MSIEEGLYTKLSGTSAIKAIVGTSKPRIYPLLMPDKASYPAIVYTKISGPREQIMGGASGLAHPRIQIECWASSYSDVKALADVVRKSIDGNVNTSWGTTSIKACILEDEGDLLEISEDQSEKRRYGIRQDYEIWHIEATS